MPDDPAWRPMHEAPRDAAVRLFLPGISFQADAQGRPIPGTIAHGECIGAWDKRFDHWVDVDSHQNVYPSQWKPLDRPI